MTGIEIAAVVATVASTAIAAKGAIDQGNAAKTSANFQAMQLNQQAGQDRATAQRQMAVQRQQAAVAGSRVRALAASDGGNADPSVINIMGDIQGQGEYNALSALYNGNERASGQEMQASGAIYSGKQAQKAGYMKATSGVLAAAGSLMGKYSPTGGSFSGAQLDNTAETNGLDQSAQDIGYF